MPPWVTSSQYLGNKEHLCLEESHAEVPYRMQSTSTNIGATSLQVRPKPLCLPAAPWKEDGLCFPGMWKPQRPLAPASLASEQDCHGPYLVTCEPALPPRQRAQQMSGRVTCGRLWDPRVTVKFLTELPEEDRPSTPILQKKKRKPRRVCGLAGVSGQDGGKFGAPHPGPLHSRVRQGHHRQL